MEIESLVKLFLSELLVDKFDIVRGDLDTSKERIDIWLDQKKQAPTDNYAAHEVIAYGFTNEKIVQDFPVRGNAVFLHIRRRKWQVVETGKIFSQEFDITYQGTKLTKELAAFLKATN